MSKDDLSDIVAADSADFAEERNGTPPVGQLVDIRAIRVIRGWKLARAPVRSLDGSRHAVSW